MTTEEDRAFVEKVKSVGHIKGFKPGRKHATPVVNDTDGSIGGRQVEHYDGRVDAEITPSTLVVKAKAQGKDED